MSPPYVIYDMQTGMVAVGPDGERIEFLDVPPGHRIAVINATTNTRISDEIVRPKDVEFVHYTRSKGHPGFDFYEGDEDMPALRPEITTWVEPAEIVPSDPPASRREVPLVPSPTARSVVHVGPERACTTLRMAVAIAQDGETIEIDSGTYTEDNALVIDKRLTIRGVGDVRPKLFRTTLITQADVSIESLHFEGCDIGPAIRSQSGKLLVSNCGFKNNRTGVMCDGKADSAVIVTDSAFDHNAVVDVSVNDIKELVVGGCQLRDAGLGPQIKSRAKKTSLIDCTIEGHVDLVEGSETTIRHSTISGTVHP